jgi:PAS domain S-box-containing protein
MITILLVDHSLGCEPSVRSLLSALSPDQFQVNCCSGYHAILEGFRSQTADICVIDSFVGNGSKLLAQARSVGLSVPIVVVTANQASEVMTAIQNGAADCLVRDQVTPASIERSLCCAVEQARSAALQSERERRYLALFDSLEDIIYTHDLDGHITSMNRAGLLLLGYSLPQILGMDVSAIVAAASQPLVSRTLNLLLDAQTRTTIKMSLSTKAGESLTVEMNAHPIYEQGETIEVQVLARPLERPATFHGKRTLDSVYSSAPPTSFQLQPQTWSPEARSF